MSILLIPNCTFLSEVSRMIEIYRALRKLDLPARIATHGGTYEFIFVQENISYDRINPLFSEDFCRRYLANVLKGRWDSITKTEIVDQIQGEIEFFKETKAKVVISGFTLTARLSTTATGIPLVVTHLGSFVPLVIEKKMTTFYDVFHNPFTHLLPRNWVDRLAKIMMLRLKGATGSFNQAARHLHIEPVAGLIDLLMGDYNLITDVPEILQISAEEVEQWKPAKSLGLRPGARMAYTGPIYARLFGEVPEDVREFLETDLPKIYVAMNSGYPEDLMQVYKTLLNMEVKAVICSTVHSLSSDNSAHIIIRDFLPSDQVMPLCDLAIINGGQGTVQTAISAGIPVIGFPLQPEQNFNLYQVQKLGGGICMSLFDLRRGKLRKVIQQILADPSFKESMTRLKELQAGKDGPMETARFVKRLIGV
jgi:UDP:flavonoid glycosyltransferase YjiC (YdhE family)